jgi:hypothetical protein
LTYYSRGRHFTGTGELLSFGGDTVRELQLFLNLHAEHLLDWFHVSMRLTVMNQMAKGLGPEESESRAGALKQLESIKMISPCGIVSAENSNLSLSPIGLTPGK